MVSIENKNYNLDISRCGMNVEETTFDNIAKDVNVRNCTIVYYLQK